jgi:hypothetical protein
MQAELPVCLCWSAAVDVESDVPQWVVTEYGSEVAEANKQPRVQHELNSGVSLGPEILGAKAACCIPPRVQSLFVFGRLLPLPYAVVVFNAVRFILPLQLWARAPDKMVELAGT